MKTLFIFLSIVLAETSFAANEMYGIFMVVKGDVKVVSKSATSVAKVGAKVFPGDQVQSGADARAKIVMSDRNVINISPDTKLEITKYENDGANKNVEMNLLQGKVRNNVEQKYDEDKNKFMIKTPTAVAGVRGTQFFTSFDPKTRITSIVTLRGAVTFASISATGAISAPVVVKKGESTSAASGSNPEPPKPMPKEELKKVDQESTASSAPKNENANNPKQANNERGEKSGDKKDVADGGNKTGPTDAGRNPSSVDGNNRPPEPGANQNAGPKLVERTDLDSTQFREMRPPAMDASRPPPPNVIPSNLPPPPPTDLINDIVRGKIGRGKLVITPL